MSAIREKNAEFASGQNPIPVADIDANWLICNKTKASESTKVRASKVVAIMSFFCDHGLLVKPVADPEKRHHSKRAPVKRRANKVILASAVRATRCKLSKLNQEILSKNTRIEELVSLKKQVAEIEKAAKKSVPNAVSLIDAA